MRTVIVLAFFVFGQQSKPDLNGTWVLNPIKSEKAIAQGQSAVRGQMTITVTDKQATFAWMLPGADGKPEKPQNPNGFSERTTVCAFGDKPAENIRPMAPVYCAVKWEDDQLVATSYALTSPMERNMQLVGTTTYTVSGSELRISSAGPRPKGGEAISSTVFWDRAK